MKNKNKASKKIPAVLVYVVQDKKVLLAKKVKKINAGRYTGYGGKIEKGETELDTAKRELKQESGLTVDIESLEKVGLIDFYNEDGGVWRVHVFIVHKFKGKPKSTKEMEDPKWFPISNMPFGRMNATDVFWLPIIFRGVKINAKVRSVPLKVTFEVFDINYRTLAGE